MFSSNIRSFIKLMMLPILLCDAYRYDEDGDNWNLRNTAEATYYYQYLLPGLYNNTAPTITTINNDNNSNNWKPQVREYGHKQDSNQKYEVSLHKEQKNLSGRFKETPGFNERQAFGGIGLLAASTPIIFSIISLGVAGISGFVAFQATSASNSNENEVNALKRRIAELEASTSTSVALLQTSATSLTASLRNTCGKLNSIIGVDPGASFLNITAAFNYANGIHAIQPPNCPS